MIEFSVVVIAVAFVVLVGSVVSILIQIRRTVSQSEHLLSQMNDALPGILKEVRQTNKKHPGHLPCRRGKGWSGLPC